MTLDPKLQERIDTAIVKAMETAIPRIVDLTIRMFEDTASNACLAMDKVQDAAVHVAVHTTSCMSCAASKALEKAMGDEAALKTPEEAKPLTGVRDPDSDPVFDDLPTP